MVGLRTLLNAELRLLDQRSGDVSLQAKLSAPPGLPTISEVANLETGGGHRYRNTSDGKFQTKGERIYAIQYRRVIINFPKGEPFLTHGTHWKPSVTRSLFNDEVIETDINEDDEHGDEEIETIVNQNNEERFIWLADTEGSELSQGNQRNRQNSRGLTLSQAMSLLGIGIIFIWIIGRELAERKSL